MNYQGLSTRETSQVLGISRNAVCIRLSRAVEKLRHELGRVLAIPALLTLLVSRRASAAPATLTAALQQLAGTAPLPAAGGLAVVLGSALSVKLTTAVLVVSTAVVGGIRTATGAAFPAERRRCAGRINTGCHNFRLPPSQTPRCLLTVHHHRPCWPRRARLP